MIKLASIPSRGLMAGLVVGVLVLASWVSLVQAEPMAQEGEPHPPIEDEPCKVCHLNVTDSWKHSPHAHAFNDPYFQQRWKGLGEPGDCLSCHTTGYQASTNTYHVEGVSCSACHGEVKADHPPAVVPIRADTEYCGVCHTTTLHEWRLTGHASAQVGCMDCHDPHSQKRLFAVSDDMCINCHKEDMEDYLVDVHYQKNIGCVACHALVIPPETPPVDGIVPTGHTFTLTPQTCVACHTDVLHAGFSLPGYENGAKNAHRPTLAAMTPDTLLESGQTRQELELSAEQRIQTLEAALASNRLANYFQGSVVGLVLGATTAWLIATNIIRARREEK